MEYQFCRYLYGVTFIREGQPCFDSVQTDGYEGELNIKAGGGGRELV